MTSGVLDQSAPATAAVSASVSTWTLYKTLAFYICLAAPTAVWALFVIPVYLSHDSQLSLALIEAIITASPVVGGDFSIFGEVTPLVLAGTIVALTPSTNAHVKYSAVFLLIVAYVAFIQLSVFFTTGPGSGLLSAIVDDPVPAQKVILNFVSNVRITVLVTAAVMLGYKFKTS